MATKTQFIRINDVSEINTSKTTVKDLSNRYIDTYGNMYGLRYNRVMRKIDVVKIIRTPVKAAGHFQQQIQVQKKNGKSDVHEPVFDVIEESAWEEANARNAQSEGESGPGEVISLAFDPVRHINQMIESMTTHKSRLQGIIVNVTNSKLVYESDKMAVGQLNDIFKNLEVDGSMRIDKILAYYKELKSYPRSITYYVSKLDNRGARIVEGLNSDDEKFEFILFHEMFHSIRNLYRTLQKILKDLDYFIDSQTPEAGAIQKQNLTDARTSINNTIIEASAILKENKKLEDYIYDTNNF